MATGADAPTGTLTHRELLSLWGQGPGGCETLLEPLGWHCDPNLARPSLDPWVPVFVCLRCGEALEVRPAAVRSDLWVPDGRAGPPHLYRYPYPMGLKPTR